MISRISSRAKQLKIEIHALYLASKDPRTPWYAKAVAAFVVGYALSPIDLIPDFIPLLGYLDDLVIVPAGVALLIKMIPREVLEDCRARARSQPLNKRQNWIAAIMIILIWLLAIYWVITLIWEIYPSSVRTSKLKTATGLVNANPFHMSRGCTPFKKGGDWFAVAVLF